MHCIISVVCLHAKHWQYIRRVNHSAKSMLISICNATTSMLLVWNLFFCSGQPVQTATELTEKLLYQLFQSNSSKAYNKWIRPVPNSDEILEVQLKLTVRQLLDVDEKNQLMHTNVWLKQSWIDVYLQWDPEHFQNLTSVYVPSEWIWTPDIVLMENADGNFTVSHMTSVLLRHDGNVTWEPPATYKSLCNIDVTYFPFDIQNCTMRFASWTYPSNQLKLVSWNNQIDFSELLDNGEWSILEAIVSQVYSNNRVVDPDRLIESILEHDGLCYSFVMKRLPLFYTVFLITPCMGISFLTAFVFYLPTASQEKITLCTSVLLAHTFYLLVITEIIPSTSNAIPLIGEYLLFTMIFITLSIAVTTINITIHYRTDSTYRPIPQYFRAILIRIGPKLLGLKTLPQASHKIQGQKGESSLDQKFYNHNEIKSFESTSPTYVKDILQCIQFLVKVLEKKKEKKKEAEEWMYASMVLDRILLVIFLSIVLVGTIVLFLPAIIN